MSDSDLIRKIVSFDIDIEEEIDEDPLAHRKATGAPSEATEEQSTEQEAGMKQEQTKEEEFKVNIKQEVLDEPENCERVENGASGGLLARRQYIYRRQRRNNGATRSTRENAEGKKDGEDTPKRKSDNETGEDSGVGESGEGENGEGTSGEGTSGDGPSEEKKAKTEEPSNAENNDSNSDSKSSSDCFIVFD